jgi:dihydroorotate dehydrogenase
MHTVEKLLTSDLRTNTTTKTANRLATTPVNRDNNYSGEPLHNLSSELLQQLERRTAEDESKQ